jgi:ribosomal protein L32
MIVWEFRCLGDGCDCEREIPADETDFSPTSLGLPECPDCGEWMQHVGPVLDECDNCGQELLYQGCSGLGKDTLCERCYERAEAML